MNNSGPNTDPIERRAARWALGLTALLHGLLAVGLVSWVRRGAIEPADVGRARVTLDVVQARLETEPQPTATPAREGEKRERAADGRVQPSALTTQQETGPDAQWESEDLLHGARAEVSAEQIALARLRTLVERGKYYPEAARRAGYAGVVEALVAVNKDGTVGDSRIERCSGHPLLGRAALRTLQGIAGERLGVELPRDIEARIQIRFALESSP